MLEEWRDIEGLEGVFQVSNFGRVRSLDHFSTNGRAIVLYKGRVRKPFLAKGYLMIRLRGKNYYVHRLVAKAFVKNPNAYLEVNHKDENKLNNLAENLEWCTRSYNMRYNGLMDKKGISVIQCDSSGVEIKRYPTIAKAARENNLDASSIWQAIKGKRNHVGGYIWREVNGSNKDS